MGRVWNLIKGFFGLFVSKVEQEHPEIVYQNSIDSLTQKAVQLRQAAAAIIRRRDEIEDRYENKAREAKEIEAQLTVAVNNGDEEIGTLLVEKKDVLDSEIADLTVEMEQARADANDVKSALLKIQGEREKLVAEKDRMVGKLASAQARVKIQEQLDGLSLDSDVKALDNVRTHIKNKIAEANLGKELSESSLDARLEKIKSQVGSVQAQTKFQQMRQQHLNAQNQQGNKSL
ncbi:MAG TPA: PspA/IM30 family protein [Pyrinomonadaceae bacterium]|nr:PspA/IM30 family protein [Pyrinomonadaceae bacterium]